MQKIKQTWFYGKMSQCTAKNNCSWKQHHVPFIVTPTTSTSHWDRPHLICAPLFLCHLCPVSAQHLSEFFSPNPQSKSSLLWPEIESLISEEIPIGVPICEPKENCFWHLKTVLGKDTNWKHERYTGHHLQMRFSLFSLSLLMGESRVKDGGVSPF